MSVQKALYSEKRRHREATYASRRKALDESIQEELSREKESSSITLVSTSKKDYEAYFKALLRSATVLDASNTPQTSLPCLEVYTDKSKMVIDERHDYGPDRKKQVPISSTLNRQEEKFSKAITDMEVFIRVDKKRDDTSGITDADFERDFLLNKRRSGKVLETSTGNVSLISYGSLPESIKNEDTNDKENMPGSGRCGSYNSQSPGVRVVHNQHSTSCKPTSLGDRITSLERKMGLLHSDGEKSSCPEELNQHLCCKERLMQQKQGDGRASVSVSTSLHDLAPTKLEARFNRTSTAPSSETEVPKVFHGNLSVVRDKNIVGNASKCQWQLKHMSGSDRNNVDCSTREGIQQVPNQHAMVAVTKERLEQDGRIVRGAHNEESSELPISKEGNQRLGKGMTASNSYLADKISERIDNVLHRYRNDGILDAHLLLQSGSTVDMEDDHYRYQAYGKLYAA